MKAFILHMSTSLLAAILLMAAAVSCVEPFTPVDPFDGSFTLAFQVSVPNAGSLATKAETITPEEEESEVHELQIWAFKSGDNGAAVAYRNILSTSTPQSGIYEGTLTLPRSLVTADNPKLDFFVIANDAAIGNVEKKDGDNDVTGTMTRSELIAWTFGKSGTGQAATDYFGTTTKVDAVSNDGLPMSCFDVTGFDITFLQYGLTTLQMAAIQAKATGSTKDSPYALSAFDEGPNQLSDTQKDYIQNTLCPRPTGSTAYPSWSTLWGKLCPSFQLKRAVSKIRFVFTKAQNMSESTEIVSIEVFSDESGQGAIPGTTYLFEHDPVLPDNPTFEKLTWGSSSAPLLINGSIKTIDTPHRLLWTSGMTAQAYTNLLNTARNRDEITEKRLYLRESDRALKCKISYKIGDTPGEATFALPDGVNFHRNSWWTIYAFFMSYKLNFQVTVNDDWDTYGKGAISVAGNVN